MTALAIYARYSSDNQRDASIEDQIRICKERADKEGWAITATYTDQAVSGASLLRPGIQNLIREAQDGRFNIILAEALDRLSRDQEDIAGFYKRMRFAGVRIVTLSEGEISELHIGLKGTMGALYLKDLADKTRRGLRGRIEAGKSGGGNSYGYDVIKSFDAQGEPVHGDRKINEAQAAIIRRIFNEYADGTSPRAIAKTLNAEGIPGPRGVAWGPSTIHGNRQRGTGILNNELYIGRLVWNRLTYIKDPDTGKRVSRPNKDSELIAQDLPSLRIIDQELWDKVKARQGELEAGKTAKGAKGYWDRRRPQYLFSGLIKCGVCGGSVVTWNRIYLGCANARNKGTCSNKRTIRRDVLEETVLDGLQHRLMDPALTEVFCREYTKHRNRLLMERNAGREAATRELAKVNKDLDRLVQALIDGTPASILKDRMSELERRKTELESQQRDPEPATVLEHPNMAGYYREQVAKLREALNRPDHRARSAEILRKLIESIVLKPATENGHEVPEIEIHGHIAGILALATKSKKPLAESGFAVKCTKLVAGAGSNLHLLPEQVKMVAGRCTHLNSLFGSAA